jgi:PST family polysaccharide transporter
MTSTAKPQGYRKRTASGLAWLLCGAIAGAVCRVGVLAVYARLLAPSDFATMAVVGICVEFATLFTTSGIVRTLILRDVISQEQIRTVFTVSFSSAIVASLVLSAASPLIATAFHIPLLVGVLCVSSLLFPIMAISGVSISLLERDHNFKQHTVSGMTSYILGNVFVGIPLVLLGAGVWSLVVAQLVSAATLSIMLLRAQPHKMGFYFRRSIYLDLMRQGTGYSIQRFANLIALKGAYFVTGSVLGPTSLGYYERANALVNIANQVLGNSLAGVLFPAFSRIKDDRERQRQAFVRCLSATAMVFLPVSAVACTLAPELVYILLGPGWDNVVVPFQILSGCMFLRGASKVMNVVTDTSVSLYGGTAAQVVQAVGVVGGAYWSSRFGVVGVAITTVLALFLSFLLLNYYACRATAATALDVSKAVLPGLIVASVAAAVSWLIHMEFVRLGIHPIVSFIVGGGAAGIVVAIGVFVQRETLLPEGLPWPKKLLARKGGTA